MQIRTFDSNLEVSAIGLGCMGMSFPYGPPKDQQEMTALRARYPEKLEQTTGC